MKYKVIKKGHFDLDYIELNDKEAVKYIKAGIVEGKESNCIQTK